MVRTKNDELNEAFLAVGDVAGAIPEERVSTAADVRDEIGKLKMPGGFRRDWLHRRADEAGIPEENRPEHWESVDMLEPLIVSSRLISNISGQAFDDDGQEVAMPEGTISTRTAGITIAKSFMGSGVCFLPGAFAQAGWLFGTVALLAMATLSALCMQRLVECAEARRVHTYHEVALEALGPVGDVLVSLTLFTCQWTTIPAYLIFATQMCESLGVTAFISSANVTMIWMVVLMPLLLIRHLHKLELPILGADALIVMSLFILFGKNLLGVAEGDIGEVTSFNPPTCGLFIGTVAYIFEGIPLVLPVRQAMKEREKYWPLFLTIFPCIVLFYLAFGLLGYFRFGTGTKTIILANLPPTAAVGFVQGGYACALILSAPLLYLPAARIAEGKLLGVSVVKGQYKWHKNGLRILAGLIGCAAALYGGSRLTYFLSLTGAFCCIPVALLYPVLFHIKLCADTPAKLLADSILLLCGIVAFLTVTCQTV